MNVKKFLIACVAAFVFIFLWGWLYRRDSEGRLCGNAKSLATAGRNNGPFSLDHYRPGGAGLRVVMIYASGFAGGGVLAGIRLGIMLEIMAIGARMMVYAARPIPAKLIVYWSIGGFVEMIVTGAIVGAIYKPRTVASA
jgi:hypothetical protein